MRRFEMREGTTSKFWEIELGGKGGKDVVVRFGRIGTDGQTKTKSAKNAEAAASELAKLVREKLAKGYTEIGAAKSAQSAKVSKPAKPAPASPSRRGRPADLTAIVKAPKSPVEAPRPAQWSAVEKKLKTALPSDYKTLIETYGTGKLDDFVWLANPFSKLMPWSPWFEKGLAALRSVRASGGKKAVPHAVFPEPDGLMPWASTENGNVFYFRTIGEPDAWPVLVSEGRGPRFDELPGNATEALVALLSKKHRSPVLAEWFPPNRHAFTPYVDEHKTSIMVVLDAKRAFAERLALVRSHAGKTKVEQTYTGEAVVSVAGTSISITYRDCDEEDDGRTGAEIFACYASCDEAEVRRIVRDAAASARWKIANVTDFLTKQRRWDGKP